MKSIRKNLPLLMLTLVLCTACQDKNAESVPSDKDVSTRSEAIDNYYQTGEYNFPTNEDGTIDTTIPDDVLLLLSNQELIRLVLLHPRVDSLSYYNTIDLFFVSFRSTFNGLDYLLSKDGVENTLIEEYFSIPVSQVASNLPRSQYIDKNNARDFKNFFLEAMLAIVNEPIYYASQKPELLRLVHDKFRKKVELAHETTFYYESSDASRMFIIPILKQSGLLEEHYEDGGEALPYDLVLEGALEEALASPDGVVTRLAEDRYIVDLFAQYIEMYID